MSDIENRTYEELVIGESAQLVRTLTDRDIALYATVAAEANPSHADAALATSEPFRRVTAPGLWARAVIATLLGTQLPGPGAVLIDQSLHFHGVIEPGDTITATVTVRRKVDGSRRVEFDCRARNQRGQDVLTGSALVEAPAEKFRRPILPAAPAADLHPRAHRYERLFAMARGLEPLRTAVIWPTDALSLLGAMEAARAGLIVPVLVGREADIRAAALRAEVDLAPHVIVEASSPVEAAERGVAMIRAGEAQALMKGALHTDDLMRAVVDRERGLRTARRMSHVFAVDAPRYPRSLFITDAALNVYPTLADKRDIIQNAIDLAQALGIHEPRVAILSAVETVTERIRSTLDAAALCKMADRHQITGGILDGPLAFDNAVSPEAARTKGIVSPVAGRADILVVPDLEAGNMLAKQLEYLADADMAGIVLGARAPIMLTSRADKSLARLGSCAIALLLARHGDRPLP
jgi:phosphate acetyltransferase/phosphate butyryltransferase